MDNIFGERFFSERRAWHDHGPTIDKPMKAVDAWHQLTPFVVTLESLRAQGLDLQIPHRAIVRHPVPDDPGYRTLGIVGNEYVLIEPERFCEIFDEAVGVDINTLFALGKGETFVVTVRLPGMDVKGQEIENYMVVVSPYSGNAAYELIGSGVNVVCQNTLLAARAQSTESYRIVHDDRSEDDLRSWMSGMYQRASQRTDSLRQFFGILADYKPAIDVTKEMLGLIYRDPVDPRFAPNAPEDVITRVRLPIFEANLKSVQRSRSAVLDLFNGRGVGLDDLQIAGTGWALYNAVSEWESWRRTTKPASRAESLVIGDRAATIRRAYSTVLDYALDHR